MHVCVLLAVLPRRRRAARGASSPSTTACPSAYLAKHLQALARAGVLETVKGPRGGYRLARPPPRSRVLDVVEAIDGDEPAFRCTRDPPPRSDARCRRASTRTPCGIHRAFTRADEAWRAELARDDDRRPRSWAWCTTCRAPRSKRAPAGSAKPSAAATGVTTRSVRDAGSSLAAGAGPLAVVGLVAAGLELALLRLLAHKGWQAI